GAGQDSWWRLIAAREVELGLAGRQRIDGKLCVHEREEVRSFRGLPFQLETGPRGGSGLGLTFLDVPHPDLDVGTQLDAPDLDPELRRDALGSRSSGACGRPEYLQCVCGQCVPNLCIGMVHVVEAADITTLGHRSPPFTRFPRGTRCGTTQTGQLASWTTLRAVSRVNTRRTNARACSPSTANDGCTAAR